MTRCLLTLFLLVGLTPARLDAEDRWTLGMEELHRVDLLPRLKRSVFVGSVSSYDRTGGNDDGFTLEFRASADVAAGTMDLMQIAAASGAAGSSVVFRVLVDSTGTISLPGSSYTNPVVDSGMHTYRIAAEPGDRNKFYLWIDGVEVYGFDSGASYNGGHSTVNEDQCYFGDGSSSARGTLEYDYIRWESGGYSPVPEPGAALLAALAGMCAAAVRRRR